MSTIFKEKTDSHTKLAPRYKVILHNDDHNSCQYVVDCLLRIVNSLSPEDAISIMLEAHSTGLALVVTVPLEIAEFYLEQFQLSGLISTIEPE